MNYHDLFLQIPAVNRTGIFDQTKKNVKNVIMTLDLFKISAKN